MLELEEEERGGEKGAREKERHTKTERKKERERERGDRKRERERERRREKVRKRGRTNRKAINKKLLKFPSINWTSSSRRLVRRADGKLSAPGLAAH